MLKTKTVSNVRRIYQQYITISKRTFQTLPKPLVTSTDQVYYPEKSSSRAYRQWTPNSSKRPIQNSTSSIITAADDIHQPDKNSARIYQQFIKNGVEVAFGYTGWCIMPILDQFHPQHGNKPIDLVVNAHEQCCGHAATGYAKSSGKTGLVLVTSGPGITNCITALLDANNDSTPLMVISGNVPLTAVGTNAFQEAPATAITEPLTKWSHIVTPDDDIEDVINYGFQIANEGKKGSVHIDIPRCIMTKNTPDKQTHSNQSHKRNKEIEPFSSHNIKEIAAVIHQSQRPILYIGQGANGCHMDLREMSKKYHLPATTTLHGMGIIDETDPYALQMCGQFGNPAANHALQNADCIIGIGSRFDDRTTCNITKYAPRCKNFIHLNIEESEINKVVNSQYFIVGDTKETVPLLLRQLEATKHLEDDRSSWLRQIQQWKAVFPFEYVETKYLKTQEVLIELNKQISDKLENVMFTTGVGNHQMMAAQFIDWRFPNRMLTSGSLGVMGTGLPYSIGAQLAHPDRTVINIDGDSSFLMTCGDLKTVKEHDLPIKILILNNGCQDMVRYAEVEYFCNRFVATGNIGGPPSFAALAQSFGIKALVTHKYDLSEKMDYFLNYKGPILMECITVPDECFPIVPPGMGLSEQLMGPNHNVYLGHLGQDDDPPV